MATMVMEDEGWIKWRYIVNGDGENGEMVSIDQVAVKSTIRIILIV